ncbi:hypothetical protein BJF79_24600 [Actinomadura sp. CNU-125]|uniref:hypothetical protein n=1 Tax=Actinomadura sp. CNU-125 TaxID=1904961 RepID=UPI00096602C6|nr:hypothetical protein [Actinomadura sp. CNU-125]OLT11248.1 hypothetical protein BJF79_24600 [Actinomadura sp. CNU-125]
MQPTPPLRTPANELRPGRHWYVAAAAIAVALIALGVVVGASRLGDATGAVDTGRRFANGDTVTVRVEPGSEVALWAKFPGKSPGPQCDITGPGDPALTDPGTDLFLTRDESWALLYTIDVSQAAGYKIVCESEALSRYAFGGTGGLFSFVGWLIAGVLLSAAGIGAGVVIAIVTAVRRRAHRRRLRAERDGRPVLPEPVPASTDG